MGNIDSMIFNPPKMNYTVEDLSKNIEDRCEIHFTKENVCLCVIYPNSKPFEYTKYVIWSYGNSCNILSMKDYAIQFANKYQIPIILYDYIGYGLSKGPKNLNSSFATVNFPSEENCYISLKSVINFCETDSIFKDKEINVSIQSKHPSQRDYILVGHSLGTGVVIDYVAKNLYWDNPIVLISPYKSILSIPFETRPYLLYLCAFLDRFTSFDKLFNISCPIKIFHGINDTLINVSHSIEIYSRVLNRTYEPTFFHSIGHNDILPHLDFSFLFENQ